MTGDQIINDKFEMINMIKRVPIPITFLCRDNIFFSERKISAMNDFRSSPLDLKTAMNQFTSTMNKPATPLNVCMIALKKRFIL